MESWLLDWLMAGCFFLDEGDGGGGGGGGEDPAGGDDEPDDPGGDDEPDDPGGKGGKKPNGGTPDGLKKALDRERENNKAARRELAELREALKTAGEGSKSLEELRGKLDESEKRLADFELRDAKLEALGVAVKKAKAAGLSVDWEKAREYVLDVPGADAGALAEKAVSLFGAKPSDRDKRPAWDAKPKGDGDAKLSTTELKELRRSDEAAYEAYMTEVRKKAGFIM